MKTSMFAALLLASTFIAGGAAAQPAPFNATGVTMGHWHIISNNVDANKKLFLAMGAKMFDVGGNPLMMFPGVYINLNLGQEKGEGGTVGSVVNHVGFIVNNVQEQVAKWKAAGVPVLPGTNNRPDQAFVVTPDGVRIEILEDKTQTVPVKNEHVHLFVPESERWQHEKDSGRTSNWVTSDLLGVVFGALGPISTIYLLTCPEAEAAKVEEKK